MDFIYNLRETSVTTARRRMNPDLVKKTGTREFEPFRFGNTALSIQGSAHHYCKPKDVVDRNQYEQMEVTVTRDGAPVYPFHLTDNIRLNLELSNYWTGLVYAYVPVELIERLYQKLQEEYCAPEVG